MQSISLSVGLIYLTVEELGAQISITQDSPSNAEYCLDPVWILIVLLGGPMLIRGGLSHLMKKTGPFAIYNACGSPSAASLFDIRHLAVS